MMKTRTSLLAIAVCAICSLLPPSAQALVNWVKHPSAVLTPSASYRWWGEVYDSSTNSRTRYPSLAFATESTTAAITGRVTGVPGGPSVEGLWVWAAEFESGEWRGGSSVQSDGSFWIPNLPPGNYRVGVDTLESGYIREYYRNAYDSEEATPVEVHGLTVSGVNFSLELGGWLSGRLIDETDEPVAGVWIEFYNEGLESWGYGNSYEDGRFILAGIHEGVVEVRIMPDLSTGLAWLTRAYWLDPLENRDLGDIALRRGALVTGVFKDTLGNPYPDVEYAFGATFETGRSEANEQGSFAFRLAPGSFLMNVGVDEGYVTNPFMISLEVTDPDEPVDLGDVTVLDRASGILINGNIHGDPPACTGELLILGLPTAQPLTPHNFDMYPVASAGIEETGAYSVSLFPPPGMESDVLLFLFEEKEWGMESGTALDRVNGVTGPSSGIDFVFPSGGRTVEGQVLGGAGNLEFGAALLYDEVGDFVAFSEYGPDGRFSLSCLPDGTYRIAAVGQRYSCPVWTGPVTVSGADVSNLEITIGLCGDMDGDGDVDGKDMTAFARGFGKGLGDMGYDMACDLNGTNSAEADDLGILAGEFGGAL